MTHCVVSLIILYIEGTCPYTNIGRLNGSKININFYYCFSHTVETTAIVDPCATVRCPGEYRCVVNRTTNDAVCLPSCFIRNGGCRDICTIQIRSNCRQFPCSNVSCSDRNSK